MKTTMLKFPKCRSEAKRKKISLRDRLLGGFAKLIVFVDPAPTPIADKHSGNMYRCPNCGHEWCVENNTSIE